MEYCCIKGITGIKKIVKVDINEKNDDLDAEYMLDVNGLNLKKKLTILN